jgi:hypothetical protein
MIISQKEQAAIDEFLDSEDIVEAAFKLGNDLESATNARGQICIKKSQINGFFESLCMARRFADIEAFVMRKVGQDRWPRAVGRRALAQLKTLREKGAEIAPQEQSRLFVRLALARGWARLVASEFFFQRGGNEAR